MGRREENEKLIRELYNDKDPLWADVKEAERDFPVYIFYKNTPGGRRFVCTACGEYELQSIARTVYPEEAEALAAGHNENGICPRCRRRAIYKNEGKAKSGRSLRDSRNVAFIYPRGEELCLIVSVCMYRLFDPLARDAVQNYINTVYVLRPGDGRRYDVWYRGQRTYEATPETSKTYSPFVNGSSLSSTVYPYTVYGRERLRGCFLRHSGLELWEKISTSTDVEYLYAYCTHPQFEYLLKSGDRWIVEQCIWAKDYMKSIFDWSAAGRGFFKKLSPAELRELRGMRCPAWVVKTKEYYRLCRKLTFKEAERLWCGVDSESAKLLKKYRTDPIKWLKYMTEQRKLYAESAERSGLYASSGEWRDYIRQAAEIGYDVHDPVVAMPRDLIKAHDTVSKLYRRLLKKRESEKQKKEEAKARALYAERCKKYEYSDGTYSVIVPETLSDIISEGQEQHNCVAGYCTRHADGKLTILFIRRTARPEKSLVTVEMSAGGEIVQARAFRNGNPDAEVLRFIDSYKKELYRRQSESKKKKKKETAKDGRQNDAGSTGGSGGGDAA